ncbi:hypothetical protein [Plantactinospora soyae]|uniref:Uncharacterized protein n=1 Tax=Plantactinospora soyae TaxID=1544732 RepID=A0A927R0M2_9ACTN|nr:hypothetical protein [Plantactinospora soyae]MBE1491730.1 hypothetical protein [Plantactinospora soyae]
MTIMPELSPQAARGPDRRHWQEFLDQPLCVVIECVRDGAGG